MISFFRRIRQNLLQENRVTRYLAYAVGEIILVMVGILIAMQVNNWNEERKRRENFLVTMEQIYNVLEVEIQMLQFVEFHFFQQNLYLDSLYNFPHLLNPSDLPGLLNYEESGPRPFQTSIGFLLQNLTVNPGNAAEILLARDLNSYSAGAKLEYNLSENKLKAILLKAGIPTPELEFGITLNQNTISAPGVFDQSHWFKSQELLKSPEVKAALIEAAVLHDRYSAQTFHTRELAQQLLTQIKQQYPQVKLLYKNLGLIGEGTPHHDWETDVPIEKISEDPSLWEQELELSGGPIKFRENETWNRNWGGRSFPQGTMELEGPNIEVPPGKYRIVLNLTEKTYVFEPIKP